MTINEPKTAVLSSGVFLGNYQILSHLVSGNTGEFWLALKPGGPEGKIFVAKTLQARLDMDESFVERFWHHAMEASRLDHPNVVRLIDGGAAEGIQFVIMEYVPGRSLKHVLKKQAKPPLWFVMKVACQVCDALNHAHSFVGETETTSMIHGCLVPKKVMISCNGTVKVLGFGISQVASMIQDIASRVRLMRFAYLSPEHLRGVALDHRCDFYGLGVLMYELLTGTRPYSGKSVFHLIQRISEGNPRPITQINPSIPMELEKIVMKAMHHRADKRYESAADLKEDLLEVYSKLSSRSSTNELTHYLRDLFPEFPWSDKCDELSAVTPHPLGNREEEVEHVTFTGTNLFAEALLLEKSTSEHVIIDGDDDAVEVVQSDTQEPAAEVADPPPLEKAGPEKKRVKKRERKKSIFDIASEQREADLTTSTKKRNVLDEGYDPFQKPTKPSSDVFSTRKTPPSEDLHAAQDLPSQVDVDIFSTYGAKRKSEPGPGAMDQPMRRAPVATDVFAVYKQSDSKAEKIQTQPPPIKEPENPFARKDSDGKSPFGQNDSVRHFERGLGAYREGNFDVALSEWERAIELEPENKKYRSNLTRLKTMMMEKSEQEK